MSPDPSADAEGASAAEPNSKRSADRASFIPTLAVVAVAIAALAAAFMGVSTQTPEATPAASLPAPPQAVVRAPPLASAMGNASACEKCGVVESVLAAKQGDTFQMRIRMDDGSLRTVEQRGALAAGTRVVVEGSSVRLPG
jgi:hypothetical protein